jgi:putative ABC transport system permease protein
MFVRLVRESLIRNPRRKLLAAGALMVGMAVATATLTIALEVGDRLAREFRNLGANLLVTPQSDTLPVEIGGVDYRPVDEGAYLNEADLGKLKMIFWRHHILGFTPFLDVPAQIAPSAEAKGVPVTLIGTWYEHPVPIPDGTTFKTGLSFTHPWWKVEGRWFRRDASECVVGSSFASKHRGMVAIGQSIYVAPSDSRRPPIPLVVTGTVSTGDAEDDAILVPLEIAQKVSNHPGEFRRLFVSALTKPADRLAERDPATMSPEEHDRWYCTPYISSISAQIEQVLPGTSVHAIRRVAETEGRVLNRVSTLLWIVTLAALIAAGLAVAATSATTVLERRAEVGIMKAIGATKGIVVSIFLAEQLMLATVGGVLGFIVGTGLAWSFGASVFGSPATPRFVLLPTIMGLAAGVAILGSLVPLRRAATIDPAPILRGE